MVVQGYPQREQPRDQIEPGFMRNYSLIPPFPNSHSSGARKSRYQESSRRPPPFRCMHRNLDVNGIKMLWLLNHDLTRSRGRLKSLPSEKKPHFLRERVLESKRGSFDTPEGDGRENNDDREGKARIRQRSHPRVLRIKPLLHWKRENIDSVREVSL